MSQQSDNDKVICPNCVTEFTAIPVTVQSELAKLRTENAELRAEVEKKTKMLQQGWIELCDTGIVAFKEENDQLRAENAELRRLIKDVAIPALTECDEAIGYMCEYDIPLTLPDHVNNAPATLQEKVK